MKYRVLARSGLVFIVFTLIFSNCAFSQTRDAGLWTSLTFEVKLAKKLYVLAAQEYRFEENVSELGTWISEAGLEYKLNKYIKTSINYRYTQKRKDNNLYSPRHRLFIDIKAEKKNKPFVFQFRTRFQEEYAEIGRAPEEGFAGFYLRNKFSLKLDLDKKWEPYLTTELYSPVRYQQAFLFDNIRSSAGLDYKLSKHHKLDLYYMIQREFNVNNPETDYIIGIGYQYKL